jgi:hypothetical protein
VEICGKVENPRSKSVVSASHGKSRAPHADPAYGAPAHSGFFSFDKYLLTVSIEVIGIRDEPAARRDAD